MIDSVTETAGGAPDLKKARRQKAEQQRGPTVDRLPPHSIECEMGVLGCVMLSPNDCMGQCIEKLRAGAEVFYDLRHQTIYGALIEMYDHREAIDVITLQQRLKDKQLLDQVGGISYLSSLPDAVPSAANLSYYLDFVLEKFLLRKMIHTCTDVVGRVYDYKGEVDALMDEVERDILRIGEHRNNGEIIQLGECVKGAIQIIETNFNSQGQCIGLSTGFPKLDSITSGLKKGNMIVVAARPSFGKTSIGMNMVEHVAIVLRKPVGVFSLEMERQELTLRMLCSLARVEWQAVTDNFIAARDFPLITAAASKIRKAPIYIDDTGGLSINQVRARARRMVQKFKIELLVIDYLQLMHGTKKRGDQNRAQEISDISNAVKALAKELQIPIVVLSQLNREIEKEKGRPPRLSDIRESGAIEQDADVVLMPWAKPIKDDVAHDRDVVDSYLRIAKQRNGRANVDVPLTFYKKFTRFENPTRHVEEEDCPS